jgi:hypothetical protein
VQPAGGPQVPRAFSVTPKYFVEATTQHYRIHGKYFTPDSRLRFSGSPYIVPSAIRVLSDTEIEFDARIPAGVTPSLFSVKVETSGGTSESLDIKKSNFGPTAITPASGPRDGYTRVTMPGVYRDNPEDPAVSAIEVSGTGITVTDLSNTDTELAATFWVAPDAPLEQRTVQVRRGDGLVSAPIFFGVTDARPSITGITSSPTPIQRPPRGSPPRLHNLRISGSNLTLHGQPTVAISPQTGITIGAVSADSQYVYAEIQVSADASPGERQLTVTNNLGTSTPFLLTIRNQPPIVNRITPFLVSLGQSTAIALEGDYFENGMTIIAEFRPADMFVFHDVVATGDTRATAIVDVAPNATTGSQYMKLTNSGGSRSTQPAQPLFAAKAIVIKTMTPISGAQGTTVNIQFTGDFYGDSVHGDSFHLDIQGTGITVLSQGNVGATMFTAKLQIASDAPLGPRDLRICDSYRCSAPVQFTIVPPP